MEGMVFEELEKLLEPFPSNEFIASSWGKTYLHLRGKPRRFADLLPWDNLNEILMTHRLDYPRLRLMQDGKCLPITSYLRHVGGGKGKPSIPRLLSVELAAHLQNGATLVLDAVDELREPIKQLAIGLERGFHERVQINCYAGWRISRGFDLHWDDHDVFIVQVAGRKRWSIYGMTTPYPLKGGSDPIPKPTHEHIWSEVLEDGDLLYIPRGWWHVAEPLDEPTLHLTVGIHNRTGIDLFRWFAERLAECETMRKDIPRFESSQARSSYMENLGRLILGKWDEDLLGTYLSAMDAMAEPRAGFNSPWAAMPDTIPSTGDPSFQLNTPRPLELELKEGTVEFACNRKRWTFAGKAILVLQALADRRQCSLSELCSEAKGEIDEKTVRIFLRELLKHGLIVVVKGNS